MKKTKWRQYCLIEVLCPDLERFLSALNRSGIPLMDLQQLDELQYRMKLSRKDIPRTMTIAEKLGGKGRLISHGSLIRYTTALTSRPVLVLGILLFLFLTLALPRRIYFIQVLGNETVPEARILDAAAESGLTFGVSRRDLRSETIKNKLLQALPQLQWVGVNTRGCVAVIQVRERTQEEPAAEEPGLGHIVAVRDGIITKCTATRGNLLCEPGQAVTEGQILISGLTDCTLSIRAEQARGEVYALTRRQTEVILPSQWTQKRPQSPHLFRISLRFGKKRIKIWKNSGISTTICDRMYKEYYITLPGGFRLPGALILEVFRPYSPESFSYPESAALEVLETLSRRYLLSAMNAGSILNASTEITAEDNRFHLAGEYHCMEMIGKMQRLQIGEINE